jgi:hypothetical protein
MVEPDEPQKEPENEPPQIDNAEVADPVTDQAVDDIVRKEGDDELKLQDAAVEQAIVMKVGPWERFKNLQKNWWGDPRKRWATIIAIVLAIGVIGVVPLTRSELVGVFLHEKITVRVTDSKTGLPVSGAEVQISGADGETDGAGTVVLYPHAGSKRLEISKRYYANSSQRILVTAFSGRSTFNTKLVALGHQVQIKVVNSITNQPLSGAKIVAAGATAKTGTNGLAIVVLPSSADAQSATLSLNGYDIANVRIDANGGSTQNTFGMTPSGMVYFLSNTTGTVNVMSANLDGSNQQIVLAGTGNENTNTELIASPDWKYLVLLARRSGSTASLYLINTTNGNTLTTVDSSNAIFNLIGWSGDTFVYTISRNDLSSWQTGQQQLKALDAATGQTTPLDQTQASGQQGNYVAQYFSSPYIMGDQVVYAKNWEGSGQQITSQQAELDSIGIDGSNHKVIKTFGLAAGAQTYNLSISLRMPQPNELYIEDASDGGVSGTDTFYTYENEQVTSNASLTESTFDSTSYPAYLISPSGNNSFWSQPSSAGNTLVIGDSNGQNQKLIAPSSSYTPYGWYDNEYILVSKNSQLYVLPVTGGTPLKIGSYFSEQGSIN